VRVGKGQRGCFSDCDWQEGLGLVVTVGGEADVGFGHAGDGEESDASRGSGFKDSWVGYVLCVVGYGCESTAFTCLFAAAHERLIPGVAPRVLRAAAKRGFSWSYLLARSVRIAETVELWRAVTGVWGVSAGMVSRTVILRGPLGVFLGLMRVLSQMSHFFFLFLYTRRGECCYQVLDNGISDGECWSRFGGEGNEFG
jgi:hypothetical protein